MGHLDMKTSDKDRWCVDGGASQHLRSTVDGLTNIRPRTGVIHTASRDNKLDVSSSGNFGKLKNVLIAPQLSQNLIGVAPLTDDRKFVIYTKKSVHTVEATDEVVSLIARALKIGEDLRGYRDGNLYWIDSQQLLVNEHAHLSNSRNTNLAVHYHQTLGHLPWEDLKNMVREGLLDIPMTHFNNLPMCAGCAQGRAIRLPFPKKKLVDTKWEPGAKTYVDWSGRQAHPSRNGNRYFMIFQDAATSRIRVAFARSTASSALVLQHYHDELKREGKVMRVVKLDADSTFARSNQFMAMLTRLAIKPETVPPDGHAQNKAERRWGQNVLAAKRATLYFLGRRSGVLRPHARVSAMLSQSWR